MSLSNAYKTNATLETDGVPFEVLDAPNEDGSIPTFLLGRTSKSNKAYQSAITKATAPLQRAIQLKQDVTAQLEKAFLDVYCDTILRGWSNVPLKDVTGNDEDEGFAPFTKANAVALLTRLPDLYEQMQERSNNISLFLEATREEAAKN